MSKIKKADLLQLVQEQAEMMVELSGVVKMNKLSIIKLENERGQPKPKQLDQSAFDHPYATDRFKYVALNADGQAVFFESKPVISNCLDIWVVHTGSVMPMLKGYDTSNWQNSLIERDTAKEQLEADLSSELTGSDLCRAMLARGDEYVVCLVSNVADSHAIKNREHTTLIEQWVERDGFYNYRSQNWGHAVPANPATNEPLTASEVGL